MAKKTKLDLKKRVVDYLRDNAEKRFMAREIAEWVFKTYPDECREKQERSKAKVRPLNDDRAILEQLVAEIGSNLPQMQAENPQIKTIEERPRKYYYTEATDSAEIDRVESKSQSSDSAKDSSDIKEHDLYKILAKFLRSELNVRSKRIDEKRSSNSQGSGGNKWLYPDLVGVEDLSKDWHSEIKNCVKEYADKKTKLWSFEVKILINRSNVREAFFQAVSNSSWANFGYLVAKEIQGPDTLKELRILSSLHGIGCINLNVENPSESQIIIQAKERSEIDWATANRLAKQNKDFVKYIKLVTEFYQSGRVVDGDWLA